VTPSTIWVNRRLRTNDKGNKKTIKKDILGKYTIEGSHVDRKTIRKDIFDDIIIEDY
jgi:hypothetical protein